VRYRRQGRKVKQTRRKTRKTISIHIGGARESRRDTIV